MLDDGMIERVVDAQMDGMDLTLRKMLNPKKETTQSKSSLNISDSKSLSVSSVLTSEPSSPAKVSRLSKQEHKILMMQSQVSGSTIREEELQAYSSNSNCSSISVGSHALENVE